MSYTYITEEMRARIIERYTAGFGCIIIGKELGVSYQSVLRILKAAGVPIRLSGGPGGARTPLSDEAVDQMARLYRRGMTLEEIGRGTGHACNVVHTALTRRGVSMRRKGRPKIARAKIAEARRLYARGDMSLREVAERFGVSISTIWQIVHHRGETPRPRTSS